MRKQRAELALIRLGQRIARMFKRQRQCVHIAVNRAARALLGGKAAHPRIDIPRRTRDNRPGTDDKIAFPDLFFKRVKQRGSMRFIHLRASLGDDRLAVVLPVDHVDRGAASPRHRDKHAFTARLHLLLKGGDAHFAHKGIQAHVFPKLAEHARRIDALAADQHARALPGVILPGGESVNLVELIDRRIEAEHVYQANPSAVF